MTTVPHIVFVTTELDPVLPGGAGAVVAGLVDCLRAVGTRVDVILVTDEAVDAGPGVIVVRPGEPDAAAPTMELTASRSVAAALESIVQPETVVEFQDFDGLAVWTLMNRHESVLGAARIVIRYHLPADHILDAIGVERPEFSVVRVMERIALSGADAVVAQTPSMARVISERYGIEPDRVVVGPPPVSEVGRVGGERSANPRLVVVGRLSEQKGSHDSVRALGPVFEDYPGLTLEFVGSEGWSASEDVSMREWMRSLVPAPARDQVVFTDSMRRDDLPAHLSGAWAVLVPSRLESFCLAAHEARAMGLPLIARNLDPITDYFDTHTGALMYDGSDSDLRRVVLDVLDRPEILDELAAAPLPAYDDPVAIYSDALPESRHPNSQAGRANAASQILAAALAETTSDSPASAAAQWALAVLPSPVARVAMRVAPQSVKDRFRSVASWPVEKERRSVVERQRAIDGQILDGEFPVLGAPRVSVVIPCFNHGEYLAGALLSVFEQSYRSWEVIIVDDGSTDLATITIMDELVAPRVRVVRQANTGLPGARNTGIQNALGEFIVPLDADDELLPEYLSDMVGALDANPTAAFAHCWVELFGDVNQIWATRPYNPYTELLSNSVIASTFRRAAWESVEGYDETMTRGNEDWDLWLRFQAAGRSNLQIRKPLYRYRKRDFSMSVATEADFERGRERIRRRHPALYEDAALRRTKANHYPLLSIIRQAATADGLRSLGTGDVQIVDATTDRCASISETNGKYVFFWDGGSTDGVWRLVDQLERAPSLGATTDGRATIYRRWVLVDPDTGLESGAVQTPDVCREDDWIVPAEMVVSGRELQVVRQRPEEEGRLPKWVTAR